MRLLLSPATESAMLHLLSAVTLMLVAGSIAAACLRKYPAVRHQIWVGLLVLVLATPLVMALCAITDVRIPHFPLSLASEQVVVTKIRPAATLDDSAASNSASAAKPADPPAVSEARASKAPLSVKRPPKAPSDRLIGRGWVNLMKLVWLMGSLILFCRMLFRLFVLRRFTKLAKPIEEDALAAEMESAREVLGIRDLPPIRASDSIRVPLVVGMIKPCVILPRAMLSELDCREKTEILIHECAHIVRGDQWVQKLQRLAEALYWFHPLVYWMNRELNACREELCDNHVLGESTAADYAETLLRVAEWCPPPTICRESLTVLFRPEDLKERIQRLLDDQRSRMTGVSVSARLSITVAVVGVGLLCAAFQPAPQGEEKTKPQKNSEVESLSDDLLAERRMSPANDWAELLRDIVRVGKPAVLPLVSRLDATENERHVRLIAFTLRALDDPRAIPGLIRAIPKGLQPESSGFGMLVREDPELQAFMEHHDVSERLPGRFLLGRPPREILGALRKLSGTNHTGDGIFMVLLSGSDHQRKLKRQLYENLMLKWAMWWKENWRDFVDDPKLAELRITRSAGTDQQMRATHGFITGEDVEVGGEWSNVTIGSIREKGRRCLVDLDTNLTPNWPEGVPDPNDPGFSIGELSDWADENGIDLIGDQYVSPGSKKRYYCLRAHRMKVWQINNSRWETIKEEVAQPEPLKLGQPAGELLIYRDQGTGTYVPERNATFLFITREGSRGILRTVAQVTRVWGPEGPPRSNPPWKVDYEARKKNNTGFFRGIRIEYKFFYKKPVPAKDAEGTSVRPDDSR